MTYKAKGNDPKILLEFSMNVNMIKAALLTFTPKQEPLLQKSEKFKRRLFNDNLTRVKMLGAQAEEAVTAMKKNVNWACRKWILKAFIAFLLVTYFFELYMVPLSLAIMIAVNSIKPNMTPNTENISDDDPIMADATVDETETGDNEGNVSLNKLMTIVQVKLNYLTLFVTSLKTDNFRMHFLLSRKFLALLPHMLRKSRTQSTSAFHSSVS